jgi:putative ABC transport system permease protein
LLGRAIVPEDGKPGAVPVFVMSYNTWKGVFSGDARILGRTFTMDGEPRTLVGIMPPRFHAYGSQEQVWIPITRTPGTPRMVGEFPAQLLARLKPGVTLDAASADFNLIVQRLAILHPDDFPKHLVASVQPAADFTPGSYMQRALYDSLAAFMLLLLIACSNVANLLLARATVREREIAVRSALGATRGRLVRQLLAESFVLAAAACAVGCAWAWLGLKIVTAAIPVAGDDFPFLGSMGGEADIGINPPVLLFAFGIAVFTVLICGLAPALHVVRANLQVQLAGTGKGVSGSFRHGKLRSALIIGEVALSIVLLIGTGLVMRSFFLLAHVDLGFNPKNVLLVEFLPPPSHSKIPPVQRFHSPQGQALQRRVVERLKALPGISEVAVNDTIPGRGPTHGSEVTVPGAAHSEKAGLLACDENFSQTLELSLLRGRWLSKNEVQTAQYIAVISQRLARDFFGEGNPLGQRLEVKAFTGPSQPPQDTYFQIIGVVGDLKSAGLERPSLPLIFLPFTVRGGAILLLKTTVEPGSLKHAVQEQVWAEDRDEVIGLSSPLTDLLEENTYTSLEFALMISTPLSGIGLLLVIIGIFSVMAYGVSLQTHDIGIRLALGAQQRDILRMVLQKGLALIATGVVIGLLVSLGLTRFIASQLWGVSPTDPWTFAAVVVGVLVVGLAACFFPARRATQVDPVVTLRYE